MKLLGVVLVTALVLSPLWALAAEQYLCAADMATGFSYDKRTLDWGEGKFTPNEKFLVSQSKALGEAFVVNLLGDGSDQPRFRCKSGFDTDGILRCDGTTGQFRFNRKTERFLSSYINGYWSVVPGQDQSADTPSITIGRCSSF